MKVQVDRVKAFNITQYICKKCRKPYFENDIVIVNESNVKSYFCKECYDKENKVVK